MQSYIHLPVDKINNNLLNQATDLLEKVKEEAAQLNELLEKKSETVDAKWYREKFASFFLATTVLSSLSSLGLSIASKAMTPSDPATSSVTDAASYTNYASIATALICIYFNISPDALPFSIKLLFKKFSTEDINLLEKFNTDLFSLSFKTQFIYTGTHITDLACETINDICKQLDNLNAVSIQTTKNCLAKIPAITSNLYTLFHSSIPEKNILIDNLIINNIHDQNDSDIDETISLLQDKQKEDSHYQSIKK